MTGKPVYDNYEISGCWRIGDGPDASVEPCDDADAQFWTLYGHIDGQGVEAIGDFKSREAAEAVYYCITGQPFTGSYQADDRLRLMHAASRLRDALQGMLEVFVDSDRLADFEDMATVRAARAALAACEPHAANIESEITDSQIHKLLASRKQIAVIWAVEDVREVRPDLSVEQGWQVLQSVAEGHDANHGICWATLEAAAWGLFPLQGLPQPFDPLAAIMAHEAGELGEAATLQLFQHLVDTGQAWTLQGHYGRVALGLLDAGLIQPPAEKPRLPSPAEILADPAAYLPESAASNGHDGGNER